MKRKIKNSNFAITLRRWRNRWFDTLPIIGRRRIKKASDKLAKGIASCLTHEPYPYIADQLD